ncbi:PD-(D/E)XK nuclease family protein [Actinoplanes sp. G11-F43]|uniref:PD-(D/E)XK nuclease family protein n=1 Tax=Actinoplanes sp. G11-F43 TaxID=3424130 RepID=UPI003D35393A
MTLPADRRPTHADAFGPESIGTVISYEQRLRELADEWAGITRAQVGQWESRLDELARETSEIKAAGRWRTGKRTLLEVLGVHNLEVKLVACLAWILRPEDHHGLGDQVVRGLFDRLGLPFDTAAPVRVTVEETRYTQDGTRTRADLVVRVGGSCVVVEAKYNAKQHGDQCARLVKLWADEAATFVYLTRDGQDHDAPSGWVTLTWHDIGKLMAPLLNGASAGARDFWETLNGEGITMPDDKTKFYLRHRSQIEEWAALRDEAVKEVEAAVELGMDSIDPAILAKADYGWTSNAAYTTYELTRPAWQLGALQATIALQWHGPGLLIDGDSTWPYVGVRIYHAKSLAKDRLAKLLTERLEEHAVKLGWNHSQIAQGWLWWRFVKPTGSDEELESLTETCRNAVEDGWRTLSGPLDEIFLVETVQTAETVGALQASNAAEPPKS